MAKETNKQARYWHSEMKYRDIKKLAIEMGMPFPEVVNGDFYSMVSFIDSNRSQKRNPALVEEFDLWMEKLLLDRGADYLVKPSLRLSYVSDEKREEVENSKKEKPKKVKKVVEKDSNNLIKGTKKSYTFELAQKGYDIDRIKRRVLKKFPDASEKSIVIWYRAAMGLRNKPKEKRVKEKKPKVKKVFTEEEKILHRQRQKERKLIRKEKIALANQRNEETRERQQKRKRKPKKKKAL